MDAGFPDPVYYALTRPINCRNGHNNGGNHESAVIFHCVLTLKKDVFRNTEKAQACQTQNQKNEDFF